MWSDYYLKFTDEQAFLAVMPPALLDDVGLNHATDTLGVLYRDDTHEPVDGFHVNLRLRANVSLPEELSPYAIATPEFPKFRFAT